MNLLSTKPPYLHIVSAVRPHPVPSYTWPLSVTEGSAVRRLLGNRCETLSGFWQEVAAAWQFPDHFGDNYHALVDCLSDLDWVRAPHHVTLIRDADRFLAKEPLETFNMVMGGFIRSAENRADPSLAGYDSATQPGSLHTVMVVEPAYLEQIMQRFVGIAAGDFEVVAL